MPPPKKPTAAEKLMMLEGLAQHQLAAGQPPSQQVQVALNSFGGTAPTPEEIEKVANDLVMSGNSAGAIEFRAYAQTMARKTNVERMQAQRQVDAGTPPPPVVAQALDSFDGPPTPEQIQTVGRYLRSVHGDAVGQQFESYAATFVAQQAGQSGPRYPVHPIRPVASDYVEQPLGPGQPVEIGPAEDIERLNVDIGPAQDVRQAGMLEPGLVQSAKDVAQGVAHLGTLGAVPAPPGIAEGGRIMYDGMNNAGRRVAEGIADLGSIGVPKKKPRQGTTEGEKRDKNKERDLLNDAKRIDADPR